jgi:hypothetical protein
VQYDSPSKEERIDITTILIMTSFITTSLIMTIHITLNTGDITYNGVTYNRFYLYMTLLIRVSTKHICNVALINVTSKVVIRRVFMSIVVVSKDIENSWPLKPKN